MAVHYLAMKGHWRAIDDIALVGGDLDHIDSLDNTPLWYAVYHNRPDAARTLLRANCKPHPDGKRGGVPLESALRQQYYVVARWLLLAGACLCPLYAHLLELDQTDNVTSVQDIILWMTAWARQPHSLRYLCRHVIRGVLRRKRPFVEQVNGLGRLPPTVIDFICLRELEDNVVNWSV